MPLAGEGPLLGRTFWIKRPRLESAAVVFFVDMAFGAAHEPPSSLLVLARTDGLEAPEDLLVKIVDAALDFGLVFCLIAQEPAQDPEFEQAGGDVPVGLVIVPSPTVDLLGFLLDRPERGGQQVEKSEGREDVGMDQPGQVRREIGELEEGFEDKKAGLDAPTRGINPGKLGVRELFRSVRVVKSTSVSPVGKSTRTSRDVMAGRGALSWTPMSRSDSRARCPSVSVMICSRLPEATKSRTAWLRPTGIRTTHWEPWSWCKKGMIWEA